MHIVILAGGSGTRFWPVSRISRPKQLISITEGPTMLQRTVERVLPLKPKQIMVITNRLQAEETERQLESYRGQVTIRVVSEPVGRNTAPAIGLAASLIMADDPQGVMVVLPADHYIRDTDGLCTTLRAAAAVAEDGWLMTLGIIPTCPETGYGYIEADTTAGAHGPFPVTRFVEKPDRATALAYLEAGTYFWNSGMFVWRADRILAELQQHMPELSVQLSTHIVPAADDLDSRIAALYAGISGQSIDYGVMEKSCQVMMMAADIGWSDVGSWSALPDVAPADSCGNVVTNCQAHIAVQSSNCIVSGNGGVVATIGVQDLIVVSSGNAVLVCPREQAQDVRKVVDQLQVRGLDTFL